MCSGKKNGEATKFSTLDRSVASLEHTHGLSLPVAISLELPCYSYNLPVFILQPMQQPSECHCAAFAKFEQRGKTKSGDFAGSDPMLCISQIPRRRSSKSLWMGGLFNHFPLKASGTDGIKNGAHKDVITKTLGMTPCLVTLRQLCQQHTLTPLPFRHSVQSYKSKGMSFWIITNKGICVFTGCPLLTQSLPQALDRHRTHVGELSPSQGIVFFP